MTLLPLVASAVFSLLFIARTAFRIDGQLYFTLFDDAMISMRYARNLAAGHGLVWNPGEAPVEGYTNFLWTVWMALLHLVPVAESKISLLVMLSGAAILVANVALVGRVARRLAPDRPLVGGLAVWLTATYYPLAYWTLRGTEVGVVALAVSASVLLALRLREAYRVADLALLAAIFALGVLTRTDAAVPAAVVAAFVVLTVPRARRRTAILALGGAIAGTLALHTGFRLLYYGDPLPNTYYLKVQGIELSTRVTRGGATLAIEAVVHLGVALALAGGYLLARRRRLEPALVLLAALVLGQGAYSVYVGGDVWEWMAYANRYLAPAIPALLILASCGIEALARAGTGARRRALRGLVTLAVVAATLTAGHLLTVADPTTGERPLPGGLLAAGVLGATGLAVVVLAGAAAAARRAGWPRPGAAVAVGIAGLLFVSLNAHPLIGWVAYAGYKQHADEANTRYALALREVTTAEATIAVIWAGAIPYFSHLATVDLLGKSDPVVAKAPPSGPFLPGHDKWDFAYSVGELQPDVVVQYWEYDAVDLADLARWGYVRLAPGVFVRADSDAVDVARLSAALEGLPDVMHATRWPFPESLPPS